MFIMTGFGGTFDGDYNHFEKCEDFFWEHTLRVSRSSSRQRNGIENHCRVSPENYESKADESKAQRQLNITTLM
jgi:hypothetical protein